MNSLWKVYIAISPNKCTRRSPYLNHIFPKPPPSSRKQQINNKISFWNLTLKSSKVRSWKDRKYFCFLSLLRLFTQDHEAYQYQWYYQDSWRRQVIMIGRKGELEKESGGRRMDESSGLMQRTMKIFNQRISQRLDNSKQTSIIHYFPPLYSHLLFSFNHLIPSNSPLLFL